MNRLNFLPEESPNLLRKRVDELREGLLGADPTQLAARTGVTYTKDETGNGSFRFQLWGTDTCLSFPGFIATHCQTGKELGVSTQALILYYFKTADGSQQSGQWISFSELPDGRFYNQAFQGYTGREIARKYRNEQPDFERVAQVAGGTRYPLGDAAYSFSLLPRVHLLAIYWQGDEDFSSSVQILFDAVVSHYLPTDACAIAGSMLTRRLVSPGG